MDPSKRYVIDRRQRRRQTSGTGRLVLKLVAGLLVLFVLTNVLFVAGTVAAAGSIYTSFAKDLPDPKQIEVAREDFETTKIYDRTGEHLLYEVFDPRPNRGDRTYTSIGQIPLTLREATISLEDASFYENPGINPRGLLRAFYNNVRGLQVQGASSITQQLVKNILIEQEQRYQKSYDRKIKEAILAVEITRRYPGREGKDQILEWYLNSNFYGNFAYGPEAAAKVYFGKSLGEINLAEAAMLAAIPQYPGQNPIDNPSEAKKRQRLTLDAMVRESYVTKEEADKAFAEELVIRPTLETRFQGTDAPHFSIFVRKQLEAEFGPDELYGGGLKVFTTLDLDLQHKVEEVARTHVAEEAARCKCKVSNASVVVMRPRTGEILAMLGSVDYNNADIDGQVNIATAERQPGSSFKPFTYATLFAQGLTPATMVMDIPMAFPDQSGLTGYSPENYDRKYHGAVRLRNALQNSYNIPAVWALNQAGIMNVLNTAHRMGINTLTNDYYGLSLTLGGGEVRLLDMTYAYGVFANNGTMAGEPVPDDQLRPGFRDLNPVSILRVEDRYGNVVKTYEKPETRQILPPALAYLMNNILSDDAARRQAFGANNKLHLPDRPAATKTGTTNSYKDAWTLGYTPQYVTGVWVGNTRGEEMDKLSGSLGAAPIWYDVMQYLHQGQPVETWARPDGLEEAEVCAVSGLKPTALCPDRVKELFLKGTAPTAECNVHQAFQINKETGKLATAFTPPEKVEQKVFEIFPPEAADWVRSNNIPQPPTVYDDQYGPSPVAGDVAIITPQASGYISGTVTITGNAKASDFKLWRLEFGQGLNPSAWTQIGSDRGDQVDHGTLENWDVSGLNGLYTLQLRVMKNDGTLQDAVIQVTIDNTAPAAKVSYPRPGELYVMEDDEWVTVQAEATDNAYLDHVEFFIDGNSFASSTVTPYVGKWTIRMGAGGPENHEVWAVAYDGAGNRAESEHVKISVVHKKK